MDQRLRFQSDHKFEHHTQALCCVTLVRESLLQYRTPRVLPSLGWAIQFVHSFFATAQRYRTLRCTYTCILGSNNCAICLRCVFSSGEWPAYVCLLCFSYRLPIGIEPCQLPLHHAAEYRPAIPSVHSVRTKVLEVFSRSFLTRLRRAVLPRIPLLMFPANMHPRVASQLYGKAGYRYSTPRKRRYD